MDVPELKSVRFRMSKITEQKRKAREQQIIKIAMWLKDIIFWRRSLARRRRTTGSAEGKDPVKLARKVRRLELDANNN